MEQENGIEPIEVMVSGNVTEASDEQFEKASESISLTVSGILTEVIFSLSGKSVFTYSGYCQTV